MGVVGTNFPSTIGIYHVEDDGIADWNVIINGATLSFTVDTQYEYPGAKAGPYDTIQIWIYQDGRDYLVGSFFTQDRDSYLRWDEDEQPTYNLYGNIDTDSSRIVAEHSGPQYDGLKPGDAEWVIINASENQQELAREPVTVVAEWVGPENVTIENCGVSDRRVNTGSEVTTQATVNNEGYDPLTGTVEAFVGGSREPIEFEVSARGEASVEASFEVSGAGVLDYGYDVADVKHNY